MEQRFEVEIEQDAESWFVASIPSLAGCHTQTKSLDELKNRIQEVAALCVGSNCQVVISRFGTVLSVLLSLLAILTCSSCFSVTYPKPTAAEREIATGFIPPKGKALIVAYRKPSAAPFAKNVPTGLWIDWKPYGANKAGTFVVAPVSKGSHDINVFNNNPDAVVGEQNFKVNVSPGDVLFFRQEVDNEVSGTMLVPAAGVLIPTPVAGMRINAIRVPGDVGRKEISQCTQHGNGGKASVSTWP